jgi:hypothetical protein
MPYVHINTDIHAPVHAQAKQAITQYIDAIVSDYDTKLKTVESRATESGFPSIQPVEHCAVKIKTHVGEYLAYVTGSSYYTNTVARTPDDLVKHVTKTVEDERIRLNEIHAKNIPAIESNKLLYNSVIKLMDAIGIKREREIDDPHSRPRGIYGKRKKIRVQAGYLSDIESAAIRFDGHEHAIRLLDDLLKATNDAAEKMRRDAERDKAEKLKNAAKDSVRIKLAVAAVANGLDATASIDEIRKAIIKKDKYLALSVAMSRNIDFRRSYDITRKALDEFKLVATNDDGELISEIEAILSTKHVDSLYLTKIKFNPSYLREIANTKVIEEYDALEDIVCLDQQTEDGDY